MNNKVNNELKEQSIDSTLQQKTLKIVKYLSLFIVSLYLVIWLISPLVSNYFVGKLLKKDYQLVLSEDSSLRYNPFTSHITVENYSISTNNNRVFQLKKLDAEIRLHRLLADELYISELSLDGLYVAVDQIENDLTVAGFQIKEGSTTESKSETSPDSANDSETKNENTNQYTVILPSAGFLNSKVDIKSQKTSHVFKLDSLLLSEVEISAGQQKVTSEMTASIDEAPIKVKLQANLLDRIGLVTINFNLQEYELKHVNPELADVLQEISGKVSFETEQLLELTADRLRIHNPKTLLTLNELKAKNPSMSVKHASQTLAIVELTTSLNLVSEQSVLSDVLSVESVLFEAGALEASLAEMNISSLSQQVSLKDLSVEEVSKGAFNTLLGKLRAQMGVSTLENSQQLISTQGLFVDLLRTELNPELLAINEIVLDSLNADIKMKKRESAKTNTKDKPEEKIDSSSSAQQQDKESSQNMLVKVDQFRLANPKDIKFLDESVTPHYRRTFSLESLIFSNLDSNQPEQESPFELTGKSDSYTKFHFAGFIKPFSPQINLNIKGELTEFSLPPASSYIQELLGFEFESGELDTRVDISIIDSEINGTTDIKIRGLALAAAENYDQSTVKEQTAMPLNMALGMLKDSDDNVELEIPMLGNLDSPTFGFGSFVSLITTKAIESAAKSYLIKTFIPYAEVLSMTISAGEFIMKTRFEDLIYQPMQVEITQEQTSYMDQFVALMKDKPKTQVKACAVATGSDFVESGEKMTEELEKTTYLKSLSQQRMTKFKQYVVEKGIESSRVLLCSPKVDLNKDSQPHIAISV